MRCVSVWLGVGSGECVGQVGDQSCVDLRMCLCLEAWKMAYVVM